MDFINGQQNASIPESDLDLDSLIKCINDLHSVELKVQDEARRRLGNIADVRLTTLLAELSTHDDPELRCEAAGMLASISHGSAFPILMVLVKDSDPIVRGVACGLLQVVDNAAAIQTLLEAAAS